MGKKAKLNCLMGKWPSQKAKPACALSHKMHVPPTMTNTRHSVNANCPCGNHCNLGKGLGNKAREQGSKVVLKSGRRVTTWSEASGGGEV